MTIFVRFTHKLTVSIFDYVEARAVQYIEIKTISQYGLMLLLVLQLK